MRKPSIEELEGLIALKEAELSKLKPRRRATLAGAASGKARADSSQVRALRGKYLAEGGDYGSIRRLAREVGLSERHANRVLKDLKSSHRDCSYHPSIETTVPPDR